MMSLPVWPHVPSRGVSVQWGLCPGGGSLCPGGSDLCPGVQGVSVRETPRMVTSGRYSSYWNAFLLFFFCRTGII